MVFLRFLNLGARTRTNSARGGMAVSAYGGFEDLGSLVQDAHFGRDIARRADLTPFVRDDLDRAA